MCMCAVVAQQMPTQGPHVHSVETCEMTANSAKEPFLSLLTTFRFSSERLLSQRVWLVRLATDWEVKNWFRIAQWADKVDIYVCGSLLPGC